MKLVYQGREWKIQDAHTVREALAQAGVDFRNVLVVRKGKILRLEDAVGEHDRLDCIDIIAGG